MVITCVIFVPSVHRWSRSEERWKANTHPAASVPAQQRLKDTDIQHMWGNLLWLKHCCCLMCSSLITSCLVTEPAFLAATLSGEVFVLSAGPEKPRVFRAPSCRAGIRTELPRAEQPSVGELLQQLSLSDREELFFMQLPDSMPGRAAQKVDPPPAPPAEKPAKKECKLADKRPAQLQAQVSPNEAVLHRWTYGCTATS